MALDKLNSGKYKAQRQRVFKRDGHVCAYCGIDEGIMHIDHIIPRKVGGDHALENLQVLCKRCNQAKAAKSEGVFLSEAATPPVFSGFLSPMQSEIHQDSPFTARPNPDQS
jgi:5-methylcytosine-specific restriction endonuclease McrA